MDSLAGQMQFGSDAIVTEERDEDVSVRSGSVDVSGDSHHLIDWDKSMLDLTEHIIHEIRCIINEEIPLKRSAEQWLRSKTHQENSSWYSQKTDRSHG